MAECCTVRRRDPDDPRVRRVILRLRERVAQAYEDAYRDLQVFGAWTPGDDPHPLLLGQLPEGIRLAGNPVEAVERQAGS